MAKRAPKTYERELTIEDAIFEAYGELQSLGEEMREAYDNTPESLQNDGVGAARGEAADNLENINEPEVPTLLQGEKFKMKWTVRVHPPSKRLSRSDRRYEAVETLNQVVAFLEEIQESEGDNYSSDEKQAASDFVDEVQQMIDEAENVEFPGMYG
jgi:hypothetical protein